MVARFLLISALFLLITSRGVAQQAAPLCVGDLAEMPKIWQPSSAQLKTLGTETWQAHEAQQVRRAVEFGIDEIIDFFARKPAAVLNLWDDSIEALIQITYASANDPALDQKIRDAARNNLSALVKSYEDFNLDEVTCEEVQKLLPLTLFAHRLYAQDDKRIGVVTELTNAAYRECHSLDDATGIELKNLLDDHKLDDREFPSEAKLERLFDAYIWSLWLLEAELVPAIKLPKESHRFVAALWARLRSMPLPGPDAFEGGIKNPRFTTLADLATHIAHIPSAVHRFPLYVDDHPDLYRFHRQNFYKVMAAGDLDLFASFVDSLRQYGCTPTNDRQVRDGTRYLLSVFHNNGKRWMGDAKTGQGDDNQDDYDRVHRPWTAMLGLRDRKIKPPEPGSLGDIIRKRLFSSALQTE